MAGDVRRGCSRASRAPALSSGQVVVLVMLLAGAAVPAQAPAPQPIDGLFAEDWRERNAAARALIAAERIDEAGLMAAVRGEHAPTEQPGIERLMGLGGGAAGRFADPVREALRPPELLRAQLRMAVQDLSARQLTDTADLCIPWSTRTLALFVAAERSLFSTRMLDAATACAEGQAGEPALNAAVYLRRAGGVAQERRLRLLAATDTGPRMVAALVAALPDDPAARADVLHVLRGDDAERAARVLAGLWRFRHGAWSREPEFVRALLDLVGDQDRSRGELAEVAQQAAALLAAIEPPPLASIRERLIAAPARGVVALAWQLGADAQELAPALVEFLRASAERHADDAIVWAELALGRMGLRGDAARSAVAALMVRVATDPPRRERLAIATAFAGLGEGLDATAKNWLLRTAQPTWFRVLDARVALQTVAALRLGAGIPLDRLRKLTQDRDRDLARAAAVLLCAHGAEGLTELRALLEQQPSLVHATLAERVLAVAPDLIASWCRSDQAAFRRAALGAIAKEPERNPLPLAELRERTGDPDSAAPALAWNAWLALAPAEEVLALLNREPASEDRNDWQMFRVVAACARRELLRPEHMPSLRPWLGVPRVARAVRAEMRALDAESLRGALNEELQHARPRDRRVRTWIEGLLEFAPLTTAELELLERVAVPLLRDDGSAADGIAFDFARLSEHSEWVRNLGAALLDDQDPQVRARGAELVWSHRDGR